MLLIGPPGTAKSLVARRLHLAFEDATYFERLLTRFTVPEELFGPLSIKGLEDDRYERQTTGYLPKAAVAFLDETFKANSAILNSLLTLLNEREFDNGTTREKTPLIEVIGASNEMPEGEELNALFDRFLLRLHVGPVSKAGFPTLLSLRGQPRPNVTKQLALTASELLDVQAAAEKVELTEDIVGLLAELRDWCTAEKIEVSDRRWRKIVKLLQVSALTNGRNRVSIWDCWLLQHCLWSQPQQREKLYDWYATRVGMSKAMDPSRITKIVVMWEGKLKSEQESLSQLRNNDREPIYKATDGKHTTNQLGPVQKKAGTQPLFLAPQAAAIDAYMQQAVERTGGGKGFTTQQLNELYMSKYSTFQHWDGRAAYLAERSNWLMEDVPLEAVLEPTRYSQFHIQGNLNQVDHIQDDVSQYQDELLRHIETMENEISTHLWVMPDFAEPAAKSLDQTKKEVEVLLTRVKKLREGFDALPRSEEP